VASRLSADDWGVVAAAGGDGTINEVASGLLAADGPVPPLGVIPLGTANVLACEIGLGVGPSEVAHTLVTGQAAPVYPGLANGRCFLMMAGAGFDAHVVATVDLSLKRKVGKGAYVAKTLSQCVCYDFPECEVSLDSGEPVRASSVVVCNGRHYGGPFVAAPRASLAEPSFEVVVMGRGGWFNVLRYGAALVAGRLPALRDVRVATARAVRIEGVAGQLVQGDGDIVARLPINISVCDRTIDLIVPT